jgi:serine/threonine protein kinase
VSISFPIVAYIIAVSEQCVVIFFFECFRHENLAATICGSPYYMAPEIWQGKDYDAKVGSLYSIKFVDLFI